MRCNEVFGRDLASPFFFLCAGMHVVEVVDVDVSVVRMVQSLSKNS